MGLDVYVGTLTRYLVGDWETVVARFAREHGIAFEVVRTNEVEDAVTDPDAVREAVLAWREVASAALGVELAWSEADDEPYFTDKPDWRGYSSMLLLAAHDEHPEIPLPDELPEDPFEHRLYKAAIGEAGGRRFLRRARERARSRYEALYGVELWLPMDADGMWTADFVTGVELRFSSTRLLLANLEELARALDADDAILARWREGSGEVVGTFETAAGPVEEIAEPPWQDAGRQSLGIFVDLARRAVEHELPMKLDY